MRTLWVRILVTAFIVTFACAGFDSSAAAGQNRTAAMWLSIARPGLGEWYLNGWGNFADNCPQNKWWLGFIPFYGWPGYLQVKSAIDAKNGRTNDDLTF